MSRVSIILPAFNCADYLADTLQSVLAQTFRDWELLCVDDGSTDAGLEILQSFAIRDSRIKVFSHPKNLGLPRALNQGLEYAGGEFIARIDGDDIMLPSRLQIQVDYMDQHPAVEVVGTWAQAIPWSLKNWVRQWLYLSPPTTDAGIKAENLLHCTMLHPTVMWRRNLNIRYAPVPIEDWNLWVRLSRPRGSTQQAVSMANIPKRLTQYRIHPTSMARKPNKARTEYLCDLAAAQLERLGLPPTATDTEILLANSKHQVVGQAELEHALRRRRWIRFIC